MIPAELKAYPQWVCWRYERNGDKDTKVPYSALTGYKASSDDPSSWTTYDNAVYAAGFYGHAGIGFVLSQNDPYCMLDLDDPNGEQEWIDRHGQVLEMFPSYAEWSPSGKGMHIIVRGSVPTGSHKGRLGIFSNKRFMTMTGNVFRDVPIIDCQKMLTALHKDIKKSSSLVVVRDGVQRHADYDIYERMMKSAVGDKILATWNGQWEGLYISHSECDQALINYLQFYTQNSEQIQRMFLHSPCASRLVSGQKHKYARYIPDMIQKSFDRQLPELDITQMRVHAKAQLATIPPPLPVAIEYPASTAIEWPVGLVGAMAKFIYDSAPQPIPEVAIAGALTLMAGITGRAYNVSNTGLNIYMLLLARTGIGKEAAALGIGKLMRAVAKNVPAATQFEGPAEIASGTALTKALSNSPCCFSILGEFGIRLHEMCNERAQTHQVQLRRVLLDLFHKSGAGARINPHIYSDKDKNTGVLESPAYTILGESTPTTFYKHLDESMISDGLMPRFVVMEYTGERPDLQKDFALIQPNQELVDYLGALVGYCIKLQVSNRTLQVQFTADAETMSDDYAKKITKRINTAGDNEIARQLLNRAHLKMLKLAALIAVGVNPEIPVIQKSMLIWAQRVIERDMNNILAKFETGQVGIETSELNQQEEMARAIKNYAMQPYNDKMSKYGVDENMKVSAVVTYQYLQRTCAQLASFRKDRMGSTAAVRRTLETFISMGVLTEVKPSQMRDSFGVQCKAFGILDIKSL